MTAASRTTAARRVTDWITNPRRGTLSNSLRRRRWDLLSARFPQLSSMRVVDIGGLAEAWIDAPVRPREIVIVNLPSWHSRAARSEELLGSTTLIRQLDGDACDPSEELLSESFDLVYCNSVIEHVGGHQRRVELANTIHRLGEHHWVQTPYRYFPLEPHSLIPAMQFMPIRIRAAALRYWPLGHMSGYSSDWPRTETGASWLSAAVPGTALRALDPSYAVLGAQSIELLSKAEVRAYFPTSDLVEERVLGLPKSLIAVR